MKLMTREIERKLARRPLGSTDGAGVNAEVVVKYFVPWGAGTWLVTEGERQPDGDWLLYGRALMFGEVGWEWGYTRLSELENVRGPWGLRIERDLHARGTVSELMGRIP